MSIRMGSMRVRAYQSIMAGSDMWNVSGFPPKSPHSMIFSTAGMFWESFGEKKDWSEESIEEKIEVLEKKPCSQ
jgi:hypothetical protein